MSAIKLRNIVVATIVGGSGFFVSENIWTTTSPLSSLVTQAEARIGRPWTPLSVAGVARRHYRRAVVAGAVVAGGALAAGYGYGYGTGDPYYSYASSYPYAGYGYGYPYRGTYGYQSYSYPYSFASYGRRGWWW
jgi:hypothetical protein